MGTRSSNFTWIDYAVQLRHLCHRLRIGRLRALAVGPVAALVRYVCLGPKPTLSLPFWRRRFLFWR
jgi:hypothetical protein